MIGNPSLPAISFRFIRDMVAGPRWRRQCAPKYPPRFCRIFRMWIQWLVFQAGALTERVGRCVSEPWWGMVAIASSVTGFRRIRSYAPKPVSWNKDRTRRPVSHRRNRSGSQGWRIIVPVGDGPRHGGSWNRPVSARVGRKRQGLARGPRRHPHGTRSGYGMRVFQGIGSDR